MQALEKIGVLEQDEEKGGRRITQSGQRDLDRKYMGVSTSTPKLILHAGIAATTVEAEEEEDDE
jgi:small subunit ribosomal protein S19e